MALPLGYTTRDSPLGELLLVGDGESLHFAGERTAFDVSVVLRGTAFERRVWSALQEIHRVIGADGPLTGYGGGLERKRLLLELERRHACLPV